MKNIAFKICLIIFFIKSGVVQAQNFTKTRTIQKTFSADAGTTLKIENKRGKITIQTRDTKELKVEVSIVGKASSMALAEKIAEKVRLKISEGQIISFKTYEDLSLNTNISTLQAGSIKTDKNKNYEVNYKVLMPKNVGLDLNTQFGSVYIGDHRAKLRVAVKHGNVKLDKASGNEKKYINLDFGNATLDYIENGELKITHSSLSMLKGGTINLNSKYSEVEIEEVNKLEMYNKSGNITIGNVHTIQGTSAYSNMDIHALKKHCTLSSKSDGHVRIKNISTGFEKIELIATYSNIELDFNTNTAFLFDMKSTHSNLKVDKEKAKFGKKNIDGAVFYSGNYGGNSSGKKVDIQAKYSNISFK